MLSLAERRRQLVEAHPFYTRVLPALCVVYLGALYAVGGLGIEHWLMVSTLLFFAFFSDATRSLARVVFPFLLYGIVYDSMRWYADYIRSPIIHLREPYDFDKRFFGIHTAQGVLTPNEWCQLHTAPVLDFFTGLAYTPFFFIGESALLTLYLFLSGDERRAIRFAWVFTIANFVGFSFYYTYPAAPPWYVADHGFIADLSVRASAAGTIRFDKLVGYPLMQSFYGKSADVFGAIPSLHIVYPFLALCYGFKLPRFRLFAIFYWLLVCFSAIYLNHHYVLDILVGLGVALAVMAAFRIALGPVSRRRVAPPLEPLPVRADQAE
jgi:inositol phosphorylceramide synthase catalytic subunit